MTSASRAAPPFDHATLDSGFSVFRRTFDSRTGGFGNAPKFPRVSIHHFLLRYYARTRNQEALNMVLLTLREMAKGGMKDQLGGGFHRYSVDERWFVPHFEKMLYDQAQIAISYLEAFQATGDAQYADTARAIFDYVLRDMTDPGGGFYAAEDADSVCTPDEPGLKGEGAFYIWSIQEIRSLAGEPAADWFCYRYGVVEGTNVSNDPHGEFTGKNILYQAHTVEETARHFSQPVSEVASALQRVSRVLLEARATRVRPHLDDKILTSWNGLMISAFAKGGAVLEEPRYAEAARRAAGFLIDNLCDPAARTLLRRYRDGDAAIPGFLDDYAFFVQGLLDLYEAQFDLRHLQLAIQLTEKQLDLFPKRSRRGRILWRTAEGDPELILRIKEDYDGAEPSGNSVSVMNLVRLAQITNRDQFRQAAGRALNVFASRLSVAPMAVPQLLAACEFVAGEPREIIFAGVRESSGMQAMLRELHRRFVPSCIVLLADSAEARKVLSSGIPSIDSMQPVDGVATAYVCRQYTCQLPVSDPAKFAELIQ